MALGSNSFNEQDFKRGEDIYDSSFDEQSFKTGGVDGGQAMNNSIQIKKVADIVKANNNTSSEVTADQVQDLELTNEELQDKGYSQDQIEQINNLMNMVKGKSPSDFDKQFSDSSILPSSEQFLTANQPIRVGTYSGKVIGNVPIFAAPAALTPTNIIMKRASELDKAAKARAKASQKAMDALKFSTPEQFQKEIDDLTTDVINEYLNKSGGNYYKVTDRSTALGQQYAKDKARLSQITKTVNAIDLQGREKLKKVANGSEDVPTEVFETVTSFLSGKGKYSLKSLMSDGGEKTLTNLRTTLQTYENRNNVIDKYVINKIKPDLIPALQDKWNSLDEKGKAEFKNLIQQTKLKGNQGKVALTSFIEKYYSDEDIRGVVTEVLINSNVYKKDDKEALEASINYVTSMLGNEIRQSTSLAQLYEPYETPTKTSSGRVADTTIYNNARINYESVKQSSTQNMADIYSSKNYLQYGRNLKQNVFDKIDKLKPKANGNWEAPIASQSIIQDADGVNISNDFIRYEYGGKRYTAQQYLDKVKEDYTANPSSVSEKDLMTVKTLNGGEELNSQNAFTVDSQSTLSGNKKVVINEQSVAFVNSEGKILSDKQIEEKAIQIIDDGVDKSERGSVLAEWYSQYKPVVILKGVVKEPVKKELQTTAQGDSKEDRIDQMEKQFVQILMNQNTKEQTAYTNSQYAPISFQYPLEGASSISFLDALIAKSNTQLKAMDASSGKTNVSSEDKKVKVKKDDEVKTDKKIF